MEAEQRPTSASWRRCAAAPSPRSPGSKGAGAPPRAARGGLVRRAHQQGGLPDRPSAPIKFESIGSERITLSWLPPKDDGGSKITNYVIWRRVASRSTWVIVTNEPKERVWTVENLMAGHEYVFRIMAQNKFGVGEPLDSEPEVARDLYAPPGQVEKPKVSGVTLDAMTVSWEEPEEDGGTPITGYWLEGRRPPGSAGPE
ncbi:hypothetical protein KUCAC02_022137 [Chaenocephalus aceratus]|nr:hypothetical protein KUCAC02_022137 [Chaenocephalus aceratus]